MWPQQILFQVKELDVIIYASFDHSHPRKGTVAGEWKMWQDEQFFVKITQLIPRMLVRVA